MIISFKLLLAVTLFGEVVLALALILWVSPRKPRAIGSAQTVQVTAFSLICGWIGSGFWLLATSLVALQFTDEPSLVMQFFPFSHLVYLSGVIAIPMTGAILLLGERLPGRLQLTGWSRSLASLSVIPTCLGAYASLWEPYQLVVERSTIPPSANGKAESPLRLAVLADLQTDTIGDHERRAIAAILEAKPDIILLSGDYLQEGEPRLSPLRHQFQDLIGQLEAPGGVYAVQGDVERRFPTEAQNRAFLRELFKKTKVQILFNDLVELRIRGRTVRLFGSERDYWSDSARLALASMGSTAKSEDELRIVLSHRPDLVKDLAPGLNIDLVVAGHTHGGQVVLPFYGPPVTLSELPRSIAAGGLHRHQGHWIVISRGVGMERGLAPRIRFLCRPEIRIVDWAGSSEAISSSPSS